MAAELPQAAPATDPNFEATLDDGAGKAVAQHDARVSAARALIAVRKRTGRAVPDDVRELAKG